MSTTVTPPPKKVNRIGLEVLSYKGAKTTLCAGCGHNAISERIIECFYEMGVEPWSVAKFSGIGCSSKIARPTSWASRTASTRVHGRMPSVATGAMLANRNDAGHRRHRRRRYGVHRHRPVHAPAAPQSADDLHHRGQRRVRPDQGPVLGDRRSRLEAEDRRDQRSAAVRLLRAGAAVGRDVRGALLLRRQEAAAGAS